MKTFPEINSLNLRDCRAAYNLARLNFDSLKPAAQLDCKLRMIHLADRIRRLEATEFTFPVFDYDLQVWLVAGIVQNCGHPMSTEENVCCNARRYAGMAISDLKTEEPK